jgi:hypothetical protein
VTPLLALTSPIVLALSSAVDAGNNTRVLDLLRKTGARGGIVVLDVPTGRLVASIGEGREVAAPVLPSP